MIVRVYQWLSRLYCSMLSAYCLWWRSNGVFRDQLWQNDLSVWILSNYYSNMSITEVLVHVQDSLKWYTNLNNHATIQDYFGIVCYHVTVAWLEMITKTKTNILKSRLSNYYSTTTMQKMKETKWWKNEKKTAMSIWTLSSINQHDRFKVQKHLSNNCKSHWLELGIFRCDMRNFLSR